MNRASSILILLLAFAFVGMTTGGSICAKVLKISIAAGVWSEESQEEDESGDDDKAAYPIPTKGSAWFIKAALPEFSPCWKKTLKQEILVPPPQV